MNQLTTHDFSAPFSPDAEILTGCVSAPSDAHPVDFSWRDHFAEKHKAARARMSIRQSPWPRADKPTGPCSVARQVYFIAPGPHPRSVARIVYAKAPGPHRGRAAVSFIIGMVALARGVPVAEIVGPSRKAPIVRARQECFWRLRKHARLSLPQCGRHIGFRDHTTALHGVLAHQARIDAGEA